MPTFLTPNRHGYSVRFSPFQPEKIACATSQYFGLAGGGTLFILEVISENEIREVTTTHWSDGLFDVVWSEINPDIVVSASGDGGLQLWNIASPQLPPQTFREHKKEVYSVDWSQTRQEQLVLSASWDCSVKLWDPNSPKSLSTFLGHTQLVYNAMWSPHVPSCFASVSGDGSLRIWTTQMPHRASLATQAHDAEVLSCDWCKYDQNIIATAGSDGLIRGWDLRNMGIHMFELKGCEYAVRRVQFSPHQLSILAAVSYDFTTRQLPLLPFLFAVYNTLLYTVTRCIPQVLGEALCTTFLQLDLWNRQLGKNKFLYFSYLASLGEVTENALQGYMDIMM